MRVNSGVPDNGLSRRAALALYFESDLYGNLKLVDRFFHDAASLVDHLKPFHVADALGGFRHGRLYRFGKT